MYKLIFSCSFCISFVKSTKVMSAFSNSCMQKPLQAHQGASKKCWTIALEFEFHTGITGTLVLPQRIPSAPLYLNSPITPFTGKNLLKGFSNENTQWKFLFPTDRQAHHWAEIRFYCWKKIKTRTTILPSKEQNLFWLCMNSGHNLIILSVFQSPDSTAWQSSLTTDVLYRFLSFQNWIILQWSEHCRWAL